MKQATKQRIDHIADVVWLVISLLLAAGVSIAIYFDLSGINPT